MTPGLQKLSWSHLCDQRRPRICLLLSWHIFSISLRAWLRWAAACSLFSSTSSWDGALCRASGRWFSLLSPAKWTFFLPGERFSASRPKQSRKLVNKSQSQQLWFWGVSCELLELQLFKNNFFIVVYIKKKKYIWSKVIHIVDTCVKTHVKSKLLSSGLGSVSSEVFAGFPYLCLCHRSVSCACGAVGGCNSSANSPLWSGWFKIKGKKIKSAGKTAKEWLEWKKNELLKSFLS